MLKNFHHEGVPEWDYIDISNWYIFHKLQYVNFGEGQKKKNRATVQYL